MIVEVMKKSVYGNELYYPSNDAAKKFARLIGNKTFSIPQLRQIKEMGVEVKFVADEVQL